jgi:beta-glucosidase
MYFSQIALPNVPADSVHYIRITTTFITDKTCKYRFALSVCGKARLNVNRTKAIDLWADHPEKTDDTPCFNKLSMERHAVVEAQEGQEYSLEILMTNEKPGTRFERPSAGGVRLGGQVVRDDEDTSIADAVELAKSVDIPILLTGLSSDYEYEASDRASLVLPRRENELIQRVCEANPNTVVIIQAGMPIEMPWLESVNTLVYAWYGGQEAGRAIADVLWGATSPSGRLSLTFPKRLQDTPAFLNFGKTDRGIVYGEGVFVGYRYYEKLDCPPLFYFGYGLSYTGFKYSNLSVPAVFPSSALGTIGVSVDLENIGPCMGSEVVQIYVSDLACSVQRPRKELKAFDKVSLDKGEKTTCKIVLDKYAVSFWSEEDEQWKAEAGEFAVIVATSADPRDEQLQAVFRIERGFTWGGV